MCAMFNTYDFLKLISKYWQKNQVCIERGMIHDKSYPPMRTAMKKRCDVKWYQLFLELCRNVETASTKHEFDIISRSCQSWIERYKNFD